MKETRIKRFRDLIEEIHNDYGFGMFVPDDCDIEQLKEKFKTELIDMCFYDEINECENDILRKIDEI